MFTDHEKIRFWFLGLVFVIAVISVGERLFYEGNQRAAVGSGLSKEFLTVAFLDVGQGDAIYIETPDGIQVLVDGGPDGAVLRELSPLMPLLDKTLDVVLATHSDKDHVGGLISILERYQVETLLLTTNKNDTSVATVFELSTKEEGADTYFVEAGQVFQLGASTTLAILSPVGDETNWESNTASIVARLQYGEIEFMLTGDAPTSIEEYVSKVYGDTLESEVLKLGHHGSRTSSGDMFLDTVLPKYAVVSAGEGNSYGHPHKEVVEALRERDIEIVETAVEGTIVFETDGERVWKR